MRAFLCCHCEHRFPEAQALIRGTLIEEICCPRCGSDDVEDLQNLEAVRTLKGTPFRSELDTVLQ
jgi:hypothetical protein